MKRNITVSKVIVISTLESLLLARQQWSCCSVNVGCAVWFYTLLPTENHIKINMHAMENISLLFVNSTNAAWLILQPCDCAFFFFPIFLQKDMFLSLPRLCITLSGLGTPCLNHPFRPQQSYRKLASWPSPHHSAVPSSLACHSTPHSLLWMSLLFQPLLVQCHVNRSLFIYTRAKIDPERFLMCLVPSAFKLLPRERLFSVRMALAGTVSWCEVSWLTKYPLPWFTT